jgi:hypothetical protein
LAAQYNYTDTEYRAQDPFEERDDILASWTLAINRCQESLGEHDFEMLQSYPTPEQLLDNLKEHEAYLPHLMYYLRRSIKPMKSFLTFFVVTMAPRNLECSIVWGLVYLLVDVSQ